MKLEIFELRSGPSSYESLTVEVPPGYKVISGGGELVSGDILMAETYPSSATSWTTTFVDHSNDGRTGSIIAYAIGLYDPLNEWDVVINSDLSSESNHPFATSSVPAGYLMSGGGARVTTPVSGFGVILFGSYPTDSNTWMAVANEHYLAGTGTVQAFSVGIRYKEACEPLHCPIVTEISLEAQHPSVEVETDQVVIGGGAYGKPPVIRPALLDGSVLVATAPRDNGAGWFAKAKDHLIALLTGTVNCYAIVCPADKAFYVGAA